MTYYLDANIFIYANNPDDPYYRACSGVLKAVALKNKMAVTSTETIQEIIFYSQKFKDVDAGIYIAKEILKIVPRILPVDLKVVHKYITLVGEYPKMDSRDSLHVAVCLSNGITSIISVDKGFDGVKEINRIDPAGLPF